MEAEEQQKWGRPGNSYTEGERERGGSERGSDRGSEQQKTQPVKWCWHGKFSEP